MAKNHALKLDAMMGMLIAHIASKGIVKAAQEVGLSRAALAGYSVANWNPTHSTIRLLLEALPEGTDVQGGDQQHETRRQARRPKIAP